MSDIRDFNPLWGEWELDKKLGEGSFGAVWKVKRSGVEGREYYAAVKHISIPKEDSEIGRLIGEGIFEDEGSAVHYYDHMLKSIANEIDAMYKLRGYTNIVAYEDHKVIPKEGGIGYDLLLRMELLTPLTERIKQGISVDDVVSLGKDIATAIDVLYDHNMIHRDIKPQNIFVNDRGIYKLGDYGTARALGTGATAMSRKGTFNYMSPEIYNNQKADIRADIYSLGLVMYRLLNGKRLPFLPLDTSITSEESDQAVVRRISGEKIPAPKYADRELSRIVLKACAYHPENRYNTPEELVRDLKNYKGSDSRHIRGTDDRKEEDSHHFSFSGSARQPDNIQIEIEANKPVRTGAWENQAPSTDDEATIEEPQSAVPVVSAGRTGHAGNREKSGKKKWLIPLILLLVIGLIAGALFGMGILPPRQPDLTGTPVVAETLEIAEEKKPEPAEELNTEPAKFEAQVSEPEESVSEVSQTEASAVDMAELVIFEPETEMPEPITATPESVTATPEPVTATPEPVTATPEPVTATPEPVTATPEPVTATPELVTETPVPVSPTPGQAVSTGTDADETWICPNCETENKAEARCCTNCDAPKPENSAVADSAWICTKCGNENKADDRFCTNCAAPKPEDSTADSAWICTKCGNENKADDRFCTNCAAPKPEDPAAADSAWTCTKCGTENKAGDRFCTNCATPKK